MGLMKGRQVKTYTYMQSQKSTAYQNRLTQRKPSLFDIVFNIVAVVGLGSLMWIMLFYKLSE